MLVKICGTTNLQDAQLAVAHGADALGFIFAPSKRRVTPEEAAAITAAMPTHLPVPINSVGVFTEPNVGHIKQVVHDAGLDTVQMHWTYDREQAGRLRVALGPRVGLWQVVGYEIQPPDPLRAETLFAEQLEAAMRDTNLSAVLLDAVKNNISGGQGVSFPWLRARQIVDQVTAGLPSRRSLILAGGLRPENLREAIAALRPDGVDVVSGVERSPGRKDPDRLHAFLCAAKR